MPDFGDEAGEKILHLLFEQTKKAVTEFLDWRYKVYKETKDELRRQDKDAPPARVQNAEKITSALKNGLRSTPAGKDGLVTFSVPLKKLKLQGSNEKAFELVKAAVDRQFGLHGVHGKVAMGEKRNVAEVSVLAEDREAAISAVDAALADVKAASKAQTLKIKKAVGANRLSDELQREIEKARGDAQGRFAVTIDLADRSLGDDPARAAAEARAILENELKGTGVEGFGMSVDEDAKALVVTGRVADKEAIASAIGRMRDAMVHDAVVGQVSADPALELAEIEAYLDEETPKAAALDAKAEALAQVKEKVASAPSEAGVAKPFVEVGGLDPKATADEVIQAVQGELKAAGRDGDAVMNFEPKSSRLSVTFNESDRPGVLDAAARAHEATIAANNEITLEMGLLSERADALRQGGLVADTQHAASWLKDLRYKVVDARDDLAARAAETRSFEIACPYTELDGSVEFNKLSQRMHEAGIGRFEVSPSGEKKTRVTVPAEDCGRAREVAEADNAALAGQGCQPFSISLDDLGEPLDARAASFSMAVPGATVPQQAAWAESLKAVLSEELEKEGIAEAVSLSYDREAGMLAVEYPREIDERMEAAAARAEERMDARRPADKTAPIPVVEPSEEAKGWYEDSPAAAPTPYAAARAVVDVSALEFTEQEMAQAIDSIKGWLDESPIKGSFSLVAQGEGAMAFNPLTRDAEALQSSLDSLVMHDFRDPCTQYAASRLYEDASPMRSDFSFDFSCGRSRTEPLKVSIPAGYMESTRESAESMLQVIRDSGARVASSNVSASGMSVSLETPKDLERAVASLNRARAAQEQAARKANVARRKGRVAPTRETTDIERTKELMLEASRRLKAGEIPAPPNLPKPGLPSRAPSTGAR